MNPFDSQITSMLPPQVSIYPISRKKKREICEWSTRDRIYDDDDDGTMVIGEEIRHRSWGFLFSSFCVPKTFLVLFFFIRDVFTETVHSPISRSQGLHHHKSLFLTLFFIFSIDKFQALDHSFSLTRVDVVKGGVRRMMPVKKKKSYRKEKNCCIRSSCYSCITFHHSFSFAPPSSSRVRIHHKMKE